MSGVPTIVVIDDAVEVRTLVRSTLKLSQRFDVVGEGASGRDAVELAERWQPDLMLLDISMPDMDGLEALPAVRTASPDTRVVMYSGLSDEGLPDRCRALGAVAFLEKTASPERLVDQLLEALDSSAAPNENEWAQSGEMLRQLVEAVQDYAIFMLDPEGRVASWNPGAERSKQWTAEEIIGQHFRVFYPPEKQAVRHPERELEIALREGRYEEEGWRVRKDGSRFWAHVTITAVRGPEGRLVGFGKVTRDNTELREASARLQEANALLLKAAEDQAHFLAMTTHELRSPVGVLGNTAKLLREHWDQLGDDERKELLAGMSGSAGRLSRLLADLLTASRVQSTALDLDIRAVDLVDQLQRILRSATRAAGDGEVRLADVPPVRVLADPDRLAQIVENLVGNALSYGEAPVDITVEREGGTTSIVVRDAGPGVREELQPKLFQRFATGSKGGTGLGLYIVRELARAQDGDASYRADDHAFVVSLPTADEG
jgi:PAS domain S-box-containing protein